MFKIKINLRSFCTDKIWSPLAQAFNNKPKINVKLSFGKENMGLFGDPDLKTSDGFHMIKESCIKQAKKLLEEAQNPEKRKLVEIFDDLSNTLCKVADLSEFIRIAHPSPKYMYNAGVASNAVSLFVEELNTNKTLYEKLKEFYQDETLNETEKYITNLFLIDFEQSGIHLPTETRIEIVKLTDNILNIGIKFMQGINKPRSVPESTIPNKAKHAFKTNSNQEITITHLHADSSSSLIREIAYRVFLSNDKEQEDTLASLLQLRYQLAKKCGYNSYAERSLKNSFFNKPEHVMEFLKILFNRIKIRATNDFTLLATIKKLENKNEQSLAPWDLQYYTNKVRNDFGVPEKEYKQYFSLGACLEGLSNLYQKLFGISLINDDIKYGETWSDDVFKLLVVHDTQGLLGVIYCDLFERVDKPLQDSHFTIQGGKMVPTGYQLPIVVIMLNFPQPGWATPCFLSINMLENLFHEMGHAMHSMLGRTKYQHVTGTRCSTDFAEVPSILMEYFACDVRVLKTFAKHYRTLEPIPDGLLKKLCVSKWFFSAGTTQQQIFYSILDQIYHGELPLSGTITEVSRDTQNMYYHLNHVDGTAWQLRFGHLVGYGSKYHSYLVSKAIASCVWQRFFQIDPFSRENGEKYRKGMLAHGGSKPPFEIVKDFLGVEPTNLFLAETLAKDIENKSSALENIIRPRI